MGGAQIHQVFIDVSERRLAWRVIFPANAIGQVDGHDGGAVIFVQHDLESIVEPHGLIGNLDGKKILRP
jgi:hypothetical protein